MDFLIRMDLISYLHNVNNKETFLEFISVLIDDKKFLRKIGRIYLLNII